MLAEDSAVQVKTIRCQMYNLKDKNRLIVYTVTAAVSSWDLKPSMVVAVTAVAGRLFHNLMTLGKKEALWSRTLECGTMYAMAWPRSGLIVGLTRYGSTGMTTS